MNYDLAKKLKDAGFPQSTQVGAHYISSEGYLDDLDAEQSAYIPTLSELIEACGDRFAELRYWFEDRIGEFAIHKEWRARVRPSLPEWSIGPTPEEAVANLWLTLTSSEKYCIHGLTETCPMCHGYTDRVGKP
jgi:hypothetical protein